jgi:hypothetical protein
MRSGEDSHAHAQLMQDARAQLQREGWRVVRTQSAPQMAWHLVARKATKLRVVQVLPPLTPAPTRQAARLTLGDTVRLPNSAGTMEQWVAHVRPDGRVSFAPYVLNGHRWAPTTPEGAVESLRLLGVAA